MGRVKLKIKKLESTSNRHVTYSKRKSGILKKAKELSILCDIDIVLLMFSPTGKSTLLQGERSNIQEIIAKFAQLSPQERAKRKMESLEALKKTFRKLDHDVKIQDFLGSSQTMEELTHQVRVLQAQLSEVHQRLSYWSNLEKIDNLEHLRQMEDFLRESINRVCLQKEDLGKHQLMSVECATQLQEGMTLPMMMASLQESQPLSWLLNSDNHQLMLPSEPKFLPFSGDNTNRDAECSTDISLPGYSGYIGSGKLEVGGSSQVNTLGQGGGALNELNGTVYSNVQRCEQFAYPPPPDIEEVKHHQTMNSKTNTVDYQVHNSFDLPRSLFENGHQFWNPASGSCEIAMYNENGYHR
ncbi:agamous-like MADS-box protein AGL65 isoform X2 [Gastrolobium bilobum]|uniref:agamous-like MADS-box protein AGL65 isoform X2 n=1 Tax=Gastrolobium bilobum TaxID=150636 RepID=UPI002AB0E64A|nr:agamous-like MADS-box protein AGL65 isoform X2 [Gastrolobium bilobum]